MSEIIRGKLESPIDMYPKKIVVGETAFTEKEGKWFDKDGNECEVILFEDLYSIDSEAYSKWKMLSVAIAPSAKSIIDGLRWIRELLSSKNQK